MRDKRMQRDHALLGELGVEIKERKSLEILDLRKDQLTKDKVQSAWRQKVKSLHPDKCFDAIADLEVLKQARDFLLWRLGDK